MDNSDPHHAQVQGKKKMQKKFGHAMLPPLPLPTSSHARKNGGTSREAAATPAGSEPRRTTQNQAPQDGDQEAAKKMKRILASRQYSQKYRLKQMHYILQLETEVKALQAEVAIVTPRIKYSDRQNALLRAENGSMKHKLSAFSGELTFKEAQYAELKRERQILKQLFLVHQQQQEQAPAELAMNDVPLNQGFNVV